MWVPWTVAAAWLALWHLWTQAKIRAVKRTAQREAGILQMTPDEMIQLDAELDEPPRELPKLQETLARTPPWPENREYLLQTSIQQAQEHGYGPQN